MKRSGLVAVCAGLIMSGPSAAWAQWSNAALFNEASETGVDVKGPRVAGCITGGFHGIYLAGGRIRYRRYSAGGSLGPVVDVYSLGQFTANANMGEALNGDIHVALEDWAGGSPKIRWYRSGNGGTSFPVTQVITDVTCAKHPHIQAYGSSGGQMIMSYYRSGGSGCGKALHAMRFDGSAWGPDTWIGSTSESEYDCFGMARSPLDGSIYRSFGPSQTLFQMRQYTGSWGPEITLMSGDWAVRQQMAINSLGQVMIVYDNTSAVCAILYTPGSGPSEPMRLVDGGYMGSCVTAIPGTSDFYMVVARQTGHDAFRVSGHRWTAGAWGPEEHVSVGLPDAFTVAPVLAADPAGEVFCMFEYWGSGRPQQYYSVRSNLVPASSRGTLSGFVRDGRDAPISHATVLVPGVSGAVTAADGSYSMLVPGGSYTAQAMKAGGYATQSADVMVAVGRTTRQDFVISIGPPTAVTNLTAAPGYGSITLNWTNSASENYSGARIRFSTTGFPATPEEGTFLADVAGSPGGSGQHVHTALANAQTHYYSVFAYCQDAGRYYSGPANISDAALGRGDYDRDGDVDQSDFGHIQACCSGDGNAQPLAACQDARFDADSDVDRNDLEIWWTRCFTGPGLRSNANCAP